jgi:hypothetical protein
MLQFAIIGLAVLLLCAVTVTLAAAVGVIAAVVTVGGFVLGGAVLLIDQVDRLRRALWRGR